MEPAKLFTLPPGNEKNKAIQTWVAECYRTQVFFKQNNPTDHLLQKVIFLSQEWIEKISFQKPASLNENHLIALKEACCHPLFAMLLVIDTKIRQEFFKWTLRDRNHPEIFIHFPKEVEQIKKWGMQQKAGYFPDSPLKATNKTLTLQIEGRQVPLEKSKFPLEIFQGKGFCHWDSLEIGSIDPATGKTEKIDVLKENFWLDLPVFEKVEKLEYLARIAMPSVPIFPNDWIFTLQANRAKKGLDMDSSHGFIEIAIPDGAHYLLYPFGKYAEKPVVGECARISYINGTQKGRIAYPDPAVFLTNRELATVSKAISPDLGRQLMRLIGQDIQKGREGQMIIQFAWDNCAFWAHTVAHRLFNGFPNYFATFVLNGEPAKEPLKTMIHRVRAGPEFMHPFWIVLSTTLLRWDRGVYVEEDGKKVFKSVKNSPFINAYEINIPALLNQLIEEGKVQGSLRMQFNKNARSFYVNAKL